ncbi:uncharacterized protein L203_102810 [Cryptococcus depauperatus CBS 7841]|uniref:Uncharacterized protein n=1 Tax=Cryptococcus depauperatus CBS 7841 TaxID=1295531 RepID=A0AAJ8JSK3_9TREE
MAMRKSFPIAAIPLPGHLPNGATRSAAHNDKLPYGLGPHGPASAVLVPFVAEALPGHRLGPAWIAERRHACSDISAWLRYYGSVVQRYDGTRDLANVQGFRLIFPAIGCFGAAHLGGGCDCSYFQLRNEDWPL